MPSNQLCCDQMLSDRTTKNRPDGFSLVECLVAVALLGILATLAIPSSSAVQRRLELDSGLRRLRRGWTGPDGMNWIANCARNSATGWQPPLAGDLAACRGGVMSLAETGAGELELRSNLLMPFASAPMGWCLMAACRCRTLPCSGVVSGDWPSPGHQPQWCLSR